MTRPLEAGDRVRMRGMLTSDAEYDEGRIVVITRTAARVYWYVADAIYDEALDELEVVP